MKSKLSRFVILSLFVFLIFSFLEKPWNEVNLDGAQTITILWEGKIYILDKNENSYHSLINSIGSSIRASYGTYKGVNSSTSILEEAPKAVKLDFPSNASFNILGNQIQAQQVIIPLAGRYYDSNLVAVGSAATLGEFKTRSWKLWYLKWKIKRMINSNIIKSN